MQPVGAARTEIDIQDYSTILATGLKGVTGVLLQTQWGEPSTPILIGSVPELKQNFVGGVAGNDGFILATRALQRGAKLMVSRAVKYLNPADPSTITGTKASTNETQTAVSATGATGTITVASLPTPSTGTVNVIAERPGKSDVVLASAVAVGATINASAAAINTAINAGTGTHGFSSSNTTSPNVLVTAPAADGANGRSYKLRISGPAGITFSSYNIPLTGGNDTTVVTGTLSASAKSIGVLGNSIVMTASLASSNLTGYYDITLSVAGQSYIVPERYTDFPKAASDPAFEAKVIDMLSKSQILSTFVTSDDFVLQPKVYAFTNGADSATMNPLDYVGDEAGGTNMHSFDETPDITKLAILGAVDPALSNALALYADTRKDIIALHTTPLGLTAANTVNYREGTGSYSHVPIDSFRSFMFSGGLNVNHPDTNLPIEISELGDVIGVIASKDNTAKEWFSFAGEQRGLITNVNSVVYNVGSPSRAAQLDNYDTHGINPVIQNAQKQILIWGNSTLYKQPKLLRKAEVAELLVFMYRSLNALVPYYLFDPNDVETWKAIWRRVDPFMQSLEVGRAIWGYRYEGDQDIMDISKASVNTPANIDNGQYVFILHIKPKVALKYIGITISVTNSGIDFADIVEA